MKRPKLLPRERLALPLDVPDLSSARAWVERLGSEVGLFKVGLELFTQEGPAAVELVHAAGAACFLDLKLHDIPHTMASATRSAARLGARYLTVHASAGPSALRAVADAAGPDLKVLAVTMLTSLDSAELAAIGLSASAEDNVLRAADLAMRAGIPGLVCSPHEVRALRAAHPEATLVVPGVRPAGAAQGDQRRVATPEQALADGADVLVVGRPIRDSADPIASAAAIVAVIEAAA